MSPDAFLEEFVRTENTDFLHGVLGRALILATRFDAMCQSLALSIETYEARIIFCASDQNFSALVEASVSKFRSLNKSINYIRIPEEIKTALHQARMARNEIVHSLAIGLTGCIDTKFTNKSIIEEVTCLVSHIVHGDIVVSLLISTFNKSEIPNESFINSYETRVIEWVVHQYNS